MYQNPDSVLDWRLPSREGLRGAITGVRGATTGSDGMGQGTRRITLPPALGTCPYLVWNVLWLGGLLLAVRSLPLASHRRLIVRLGLVMVPNGLFSLVYPSSWNDYWHPERLGGGVLGFEDILFAFNAGATGCLAAVWLYRRKLTVAGRPLPCAGRILAVGIPAQCAFFVLYSVWRSGMGSMILAQLMVAVLLLLLRPNFWQFSAAGGIGFSLIYCGILRAVFWICPGFASGWRSTPPWGLPLFGIPLGEVAWAVSFGLCWTLFAAFVCDLRLERACPSRGGPAGGEPMVPGTTPTRRFRSIGTPIPC